MTAYVAALAQANPPTIATLPAFVHSSLAGQLNAPPLVFFSATAAQRNIAPQINSLTLYNSDSGALEYYAHNQWVPFVHAATPPASGDTLAYNPLTALWEPSPTTNPTVDSMRIYGSSTTALEVKRVYSDTGGSHATSTGSMDAVGVHTLTGSVNVTYTITIDSSGTKDWFNATFTWTDATSTYTGVPVYSGTTDGRKVLAPIELSNGVFVLFTVGNYVNAETWTVTAIAADNQISAWKVVTSDASNEAMAVLTPLNSTGTTRVGIAANIVLYSKINTSTNRTIIGLSDDIGDATGLFHSSDNSPLLDDWYLGSDFDASSGGGVSLPGLWVRSLTQPGVHILNSAAIFHEIATPTAITDKGHLYAKDKAAETIPYWRNSTAEYEVGLLGTTAAPIGADYLVGTAQAGLSAEIVVGTSPGGELGGTWASPTIDTTHSGSTHSAATDTHIADTTDAHAASALTNTPAGTVAATTVQAAINELATDYAAADSSHAGAADPHTGYVLESAAATPVAVGTTLAIGASGTFAHAAHVHVATTLVDGSGGTTRVLAASSSPHVSVTGDLDVSAHGAFGAAATVGTAQVLLLQENPTQAADWKGAYVAGVLTLASTAAARTYIGVDNIMGISGNFAVGGYIGSRTYWEHNVAATVTTYTGHQSLLYVGSLFGSTTAAVATTFIGSDIAVTVNPDTSTASQTPVGTMKGQLITVNHNATANAGQTATVTAMHGLHIDVNMATSAQQRITTFTGLDIDLAGMTTGSITTGYALRIQRPANTITTEYGIYAPGGTVTRNSIGGLTEIGTGMPAAWTYPLTVSKSTNGVVLALTSTSIDSDPTALFSQSSVTTTDAVVTTIETVACATSGAMYTIQTTVNARGTGGATAGGYVRYGTFRNDAGVLTQVGTTTQTHTKEDVAGWDATFAVSGTNVLIQGTGAAATNISWHSHTWTTFHVS